MQRLILVTLLALGLSSQAWSAVVTGQRCRFVAQSTSITPGASPNIPIPASELNVPPIDCVVACDVNTLGAFTCGPTYVPNGGAQYDKITLRANAGNSTGTGCGYDDVTVYELDNNCATATCANQEMVLWGVLDDDGTSTPTGGVKELTRYGPVGPWIYMSGTANDAGALTCDDTSNHLYFHLLLWRSRQTP